MDEIANELGRSLFKDDDQKLKECLEYLGSRIDGLEARIRAIEDPLGH